MAEIRRDPITGCWTIVATDRPMAPSDFEMEEQRSSPGPCPFCPGNERMTPPEIIARRPNGGKPNESGWSLRVVPNKFPALRIEGNLSRLGIGIYDTMNGIGAHEVIIESPEHEKTLADLTESEMAQFLKTLQERSLDLRKDQRFRYILIFKNSGESAGASLPHTHTQLIALPIVPKRVTEEIKNAWAYFDQKDRCLFCDGLKQELSEGKRIVMETEKVVCFAPFASRFPFEMWVLPKAHQTDFAQSPAGLLGEFGEVLRRVLGRIRGILRHPSYNFLLHTSPLDGTPSEGYHWHLELMPRLVRVAGFEWGSGFYINPTPPELAAQALR